MESPVTGVPVELAGTDNSKGTGTYKLPRDYFVYAGRKERGKNVPLLCEWFEKYVGQFNRKAKLVFIGAGDGSLLPMSDNFLDLGVVSEAEKYFIIKNAKALISLSDNESFSVVLMEAWLLGVPVVVSANCAVTKGHVRRSNGGLYVRNADEFAMVLRYIESNPEISRLLSANGKKYVCEKFSYDTVLYKYINKLEVSG